MASNRLTFCQPVNVLIRAALWQVYIEMRLSNSVGCVSNDSKLDLGDIRSNLDAQWYVKEMLAPHWKLKFSGNVFEYQLHPENRGKILFKIRH